MDQELARILDANFNRAREGLRVAEEFARFVVEDARLAEQAKAFRHELADAARRLDPDGAMLASRDTAGDVGTTLGNDSGRATTAEVAQIAAKRVGEALRVLCEYAKLADPEIAGRLDQLRYRLYDWEKWLASAGDRRRFARVRLYLLLTERYCRGGDWRSAARAALDGGADAVQLREKQLDGGELLDRAGWLAEQCRAARVLCTVNDRPDITRLANADGVHVGQTDLPVDAARRIVKAHQLVGVSTHSPEQLDRAIAAAPDYIALGPMFETATKPDCAVAGPAYARASVEKLNRLGIPHVTVGGVTLQRLAELRAVGVACVAVCSAVLGSDDVAAACRAFAAALR